MLDVAVLIPVLRRPQNVEPQVLDILSATDCKVEIVFVCTVGDTAEIDAVKKAARNYAEVRYMTISPSRIGDYARKINYGVYETDSHYVFTGADDLHFHDNWFGAATAAYAATGCRVIGTQDLGNSRVLKGQHSTHSLVRRSYIDEYGTIDERDKLLHEGYPHEFVDDEFIETARFRNEFVFAHRSVVEHLHPLWGKSETDELYDAHHRRMAHGRRVYTKRKPKWTSR